MTVALLSFIGLLLFVVHEFEEIIRFRPWIERYKYDETRRNDMVIRNQQAYPSTETVALMILEELVLFAVAFGIAITLDSYEVALAIIVANAVHLFAHIGDAIHAKRWTPGSITAIFAGSGSALAVAYVSATETLAFGTIIIAVFAFGVPMIINLLLLQKSGGQIERWRTERR